LISLLELVRGTLDPILKIYKYGFTKKPVLRKF